MKLVTQSFVLSREILDGLHQRGFRTNMGFQDTGLMLTVFVQGGGYYLGMNVPERKQFH
jgi:hypothetical protein